MRIRIDLLDTSERRHQGHVSARFAGRAAALTVLAALLLAGAFAAYSGIENARAVRQYEAVWAGLKPRREALRKLRQRHGEASACLRELEEWATVRIPWNAVLDQLQRSVPAEMQFVRLDIRDELAAARPTAEEASPQPYRKASLRLNGRAAGERPEDTVGRFIESLRTLGSPPVFPAVKLAYLQADPLAGEGVSSFELDAESPERMLRRP